MKNKYSEVLVKNFKSNLESLGYGYSICQMLPGCLSEFLTFIGKTSLKKIKQEDINRYYTYLQQRPKKRSPGLLSEMMIYHHMYALRVFYNFLEQTSVIKENPMSNLEFRHPHHKEREILSAGEINKLFDAASNHLEKAMLSAFYGCGLRRSEAELLNVMDVNFKSGMMYIRKGKGVRRRVIPLTEKVIKYLKSYYYCGRREAKSEKQAFFINRIGNRMRGKDFNLMLKRLIRRAIEQGYLSIEILKRQISLHCLRHSIATQLLENGLSIYDVKDFLGHHSLESTQIYTRINKSQLISL